MTGFIHSFQSLGTVDGPGIRFVVFMQGCPLRCSCCHNPDTWQFSGGKEFTPAQVVEKALRYREYFGKDGGITVSGGEPLAQAEFVSELFCLSRENFLNTCLDTSGCMLTPKVKETLKYTDRVLLDIKYADEEKYRLNVGCDYKTVLSFLSFLNQNNIPTTLRRVVIPTLNDDEDSILSLKKLAFENKCVDKTELLPFRKICQVKYDSMGIKFPLEHIPEASDELIKRLEKILYSV